MGQGVERPRHRVALGSLWAVFGLDLSLSIATGGFLPQPASKSAVWVGVCALLAFLSSLTPKCGGDPSADSTSIGKGHGLCGCD